MKKTKVGYAFSDFVYHGSVSQHKHSQAGEFGDTDPKWRGFLFPLFLFSGCLLLIGRLFFLQVIKGTNYRLLSDSNRTRTTVVHAPRGIVYDRNGIPLILNTPGFRKTVNGKTVFLDQKSAIRLLAKNENLDIDSLRSYPFKDILAHVLGYVGQVTQDDLKDPRFASYGVDSVIGKMGIEKQYENVLRGIDGKTLSEVDATGKKVRILGSTDAIPGKNITLTIDSALQSAVYNATSDVQKGAVIVSTPTGEILAMVSRPSFDPNLFTMGSDYNASESGYTTIESILSDSDKQPLLNRAISGLYAPGSTFKPIVAAAGLESGIITKDFTINDTGVLTVGRFSFTNWYYSQYGRTEGTVDVVKAIKRSNDIFFYTIGAKIGVDRVSQEAAKFGVGSVLGIDLPGEKRGLLPTKEWKQKVLGEPWYLGDDYHYGIGQGYLLTTPLQVNAWTQAIANKGTLYVPHLLLNYSRSNQDQKSKIKSQNLLSSENFDLIRQGMIEACSPGGVAWPLFNFRITNSKAKIKIDGKDFYIPQGATQSANFSNEVGVSIACKTGTAQHGNADTLPHAWITLFAPAYDPQIVITVLVESSGEGSNVAAPIAKKILEAYFSGSQN